MEGSAPHGSSGGRQRAPCRRDNGHGAFGSVCPDAMRREPRRRRRIRQHARWRLWSSTRWDRWYRSSGRLVVRTAGNANGGVGSLSGSGSADPDERTQNQEATQAVLVACGCGGSGW